MRRGAEAGGAQACAATRGSRRGKLGTRAGPGVRRRTLRALHTVTQRGLTASHRISALDSLDCAVVISLRRDACFSRLKWRDALTPACMSPRSTSISCFLSPCAALASSSTRRTSASALSSRRFATPDSFPAASILSCKTVTSYLREGGPGVQTGEGRVRRKKKMRREPKKQTAYERTGEVKRGSTGARKELQRALARERGRTASGCRASPTPKRAELPAQ